MRDVDAQRDKVKKACREAGDAAQGHADLASELAYDLGREEAFRDAAHIAAVLGATNVVKAIEQERLGQLKPEFWAKQALEE